MIVSIVSYNFTIYLDQIVHKYLTKGIRFGTRSEVPTSLLVMSVFKSRKTTNGRSDEEMTNQYYNDGSEPLYDLELG